MELFRKHRALRQHVEQMPHSVDTLDISIAVLLQIQGIFIVLPVTRNLIHQLQLRDAVMSAIRLEMHFSDCDRIVSCIGKQLWKGRQIIRNHLWIIIKIVIIKPMIACRKSGDNIVSRCHTDRIRRVGIRKAAPLPYQPIQIRCVHIVVSHRSDRIVTLLIRRNQ